MNGVIFALIGLCQATAAIEIRDSGVDKRPEQLSRAALCGLRTVRATWRACPLHSPCNTPVHRQHPTQSHSPVTNGRPFARPRESNWTFLHDNGNNAPKLYIYTYSYSTTRFCCNLRTIYLILSPLMSEAYQQAATPELPCSRKQKNGN